MKKMLLPIVILLAVLCSSCTPDIRDNSESEVSSNSAQINTDNSTDINKDDDAQSSGTESVSQSEIIDGILPYELYYKKLYTPAVREIYSGTVSGFDYSVLDGYKFVGEIDECLEPTESPDKDFVSNFIEEGTPLFYNEEKESFIWWSQRRSYDLRVYSGDVK